MMPATWLTLKKEELETVIFNPVSFVDRPRKASATTSAILAVGFLCGACGPSWAQTGAAVKSSPDSADDNFGPEHVDLPFILKNNWIMVEVRLGKDSASAKNAVPLHFVVDTGASWTIVSSEALESHKLDLKSDSREFSGASIPGAGDSKGVSLTKIVDATLELGGLELPGQFAVLPVGPEATRLGIEGTIGSNVLENIVLVVDYEKRKVQFYNPVTFKAPSASEHFTAVSLHFENSGNFPYIETLVTPFGFPPTLARLGLDTGDAGNVTLYSPFVQQHKWQDSLAVKAPSNAHGIGGASAGLDGRLRSLQFGDTNLNHPLAFFSQSTQGMLANEKLDGQLGGAIFKRFTVIFDYGRKMLYVRPNSLASIPFPVERSYGFGVLPASGSEAGAQIIDVKSGSEAEIAGMRSGDILFAIDGVPVAGLDIDQITAKMREPADLRMFEFGHSNDGRRQAVKIKALAY